MTRVGVAGRISYSVCGFHAGGGLVHTFNGNSAQHQRRRVYTRWRSRVCSRAAAAMANAAHLLTLTLALTTLPSFKSAVTSGYKQATTVAVLQEITGSDCAGVLEGIFVPGSASFANTAPPPAASSLLKAQSSHNAPWVGWLQSGASKGDTVSAGKGIFAVYRTLMIVFCQASCGKV